MPVPIAVAKLPVPPARSPFGIHDVGLVAHRLRRGVGMVGDVIGHQRPRGQLVERGPAVLSITPPPFRVVVPLAVTSRPPLPAYSPGCVASVEA
ncbi:hypothetical protein NO263_02755 [Gluconacetobacter entanii]|uniref:Uncharacterized protein n=1 Tax=Gluconacetobacter entanii TaxID=108528 RepID=A0ABT3K279_9PROT|nr:hypothetical protein [Gluconacetobacter entanii]MCW4589502.1 hypothetical protein [Gluconacetobacter entanii]MCW4593203.1 hypothetical protein [Gluconacetobacter entanii]